MPKNRRKNNTEYTELVIADLIEISKSNVITLKPDGANGTSKFIEIGGRVHFFLLSVWELENCELAM